MINDNYTHLFSYRNQLGWKLLMLTGLAFVLFGLLILLVPQILVALLAGILFFVGLTIIMNAWYLRKKNSDNQRTIRIRWLD